MRLIVYIIMLIALQISLLSQQKEKYQLRIGIPESYLIDLQEQDAKAALEIWTNHYVKNLKESSKIDLDADVFLYKDLKLFDADLIKNKIDLVSIPIQDHYKLIGMDHFEPILTGNTTNNKFTEFVLLAHKDSDLESIIDLERENIIMYNSASSELMKTWLNVELFRNELPNINSFFENIKIVEKENMVIFSVFFNKRDCALVRKSVFDIAGELNPQIVSSLKVLARSPKYIANLTALRKGYPPQMRKVIIDVSTKLHLTAEDRQVLSLFKIKQLFTLTEEELTSVKELFEEYKKYNLLTSD